MPRLGAKLLFPILLAVTVLIVVVSRSPFQIGDRSTFEMGDRGANSPGLGGSGSLAGSGSSPPPGGFSTFQAEVMATTIRATLPEGPRAAALAESVFTVFREVDARMSEWKPTSPLSAVNAAAGREAVSVPEDLRAVIRRSVEIGDLTGGAFDVTWAALWGLWNFKAAEPRVPDMAEVAARAALVDYRKLRIDDSAGTIFLPVEGMKLGLGGIAKGYALDRAAAMLRREGTEGFMLMAGGQVYAGGTKHGRPWNVGVRDPRGGPEDYFAILEVSNLSVSTSGDYESYFVVDGVWYHHILDPRTGMPSRGLRSATVVSPDATLADALSTAVMVMGAERGLAMVDTLPVVDAVVVDDTGVVTTSPGLQDRLEVLHPPRAD